MTKQWNRDELVRELEHLERTDTLPRYGRRSGDSLRGILYLAALLALVGCVLGFWALVWKAAH